jgi:hypothetical protein
MQRRDFFIFLAGAAAAWPLAAIAQNESFTIGPPANPAAKLRAQEKAAAERRQKAKEKEEACRKQAVAEKIPARERKSFMASCVKKK